MKIIDNIKSFFSDEKEEEGKKMIAEYPQEITARRGYYGQSYVLGYDGETDTGSMGDPIHYEIDYNRIRMRSWQAYLENDIAQTIMDKFVIWVIGKGLKFQNASIKSIVGKDAKIDSQTRNIEFMFDLWANSRLSSYNGESSLGMYASEAYKSCKIGGDTLVILRYQKGNVNVQLIDGGNVDNDYSDEGIKNNRIVNGVETNRKNEVIAYWIRQSDGETKRVSAIDSTTGMRVVFLVAGNKYRIDSNRGLPAIASVLETLQAIDRYKEATVSSAEERQKIAYAIVHHLDGSGISPLSDAVMKSFNTESSDGAKNPVDSAGNELAQFVTESTNKQTFNMPPGSELKSLESKNELYFNDFFTTNANLICAAIGIPPNVAFSLYTDSFSASRAATKDWEHTLKVERNNFIFQFYKPIYEFWLHMNIINNNFSFDGYLDAFISGDKMKVEAFTRCRFIGAQFPHIDPLKEVNAERAKLGPLAANIPLTTIEESTEILSGGDSDLNMEKFAEEIKKAENLGIEEAPEKTV